MDRNGQNFGQAWRRKIYGIASRLVSLAALRSVSLYAAVAILSTVFFFFLHYLGNQIPLRSSEKKGCRRIPLKPAGRGACVAYQKRL